MRKTIPAVVIVSDVLGGARLFYDDPPALTRNKANYRLYIEGCATRAEIALAENIEGKSGFSSRACADPRKIGNHAEIWKSRTHETLVLDSSLKHLQLKLGYGSRFKTAVYTKVVMGDTVFHWVITTLTTLTIMMSSFKYWVFFAALYIVKISER